MSSFYSRADEPENGDYATTERYGNVILIGRLSLTYVIDEIFWVVELDDGGLRLFVKANSKMLDITVSRRK